MNDKWLPLISPELFDDYKLEPQLVPQTITSKYGTTIELHNGEKWSDKLSIYDPGHGNRYLNWGNHFNEHPMIELSVRSFILDEVKVKTNMHGLGLFITLISKLDISLKLSERAASKTLTLWLELEARKSAEENEALHSCILNFTNFCVEEELWGFSEHTLWRITSTIYPKRNNRSKIFHSTMLDPFYGPYNQQEILTITQAIFEDEVSLEDRVLILLCRDLALRPIQLALLREEDFISDIRGNYLKAPRVKGFKRSGLRRAKNNYTERSLSDELAREIKALIENNKTTFERLDEKLLEACDTDGREFIPPARPIFPKQDLTQLSHLLYKRSDLHNYTYHRINSSISSSIQNLTNILNIPVLSRTGESGLLRIGAYRFRRTKATSMVLQGYSPEDVAYALDHTSISSVKHYFKFSRDLIDFVNLATGSSTEIRMMVSAWHGRFAEEKSPDQNDIRLTEIDSLGLCEKQSPCEAHPTVTCYACPKFRPYKNANHHKALSNIIKISDSISENSSGPLKDQLRLAISMARGCIAAQGEANEQT
ncbi:site-specific integrase [Pseudomonas taeanensis]|uniref:site-specific integrase n=1 Tax=Pseudomonas taeanensis TaxID=574962 RepID=UPI0004B111FB|nr:site-specific integrase [Pseudomonas taeanensis]